jgi:DNA-binding NtrC family response regulator
VSGKLRLLIIDDDQDFRRDLQLLLGGEFVCREAADAETGWTALEQQNTDVLLLDINLGDGEDGLSLLRQAKKQYPYLPVIMITADDRIATVVSAMKLGASDYVGKQPDLAALKVAVERAMRGIDVIRDRDLYRAEVDRQWGTLIGDSPPMQQVKEDIARAATVRSTVLITGESGTGKELVARTIHNGMSDRDQPFVGINCAAVPKELFDSELFGHEKGAFTGAAGRRTGRFEQARRGTLFLDEISEIPTDLQAKLLRVLQERCFYRVGGAEEILAEARVIASSNCDLQKEIRQGKFREDLFYRLGVLEIHAPSLRERQADIPDLVRFFLQKKAAEMKRPMPHIGADAITPLLAYRWPGNVRELENCIERALVRCDDDEIDESLWDIHSAEGYVGYDSYESAKKKYIERFQRDYIRTILKATGGNITHAASKMGVTRQGLAKMMKACGLTEQ